MLDVDSAPGFLAGLGLIGRGWILDNQLTVRALPRRNFNLRVEGPGGAGFLIKQPGAWEESSRVTLACEAAFHRLCREEPALATVEEFLPTLVADDPEAAVLIFETVPGAMPVHPLSGGGLTEEAAGALGRALGRLHRATDRETWKQRARPAWLDRGLPWIFGLHEPAPNLLADLGPAQFELLRVLQTAAALREDFAALEDRWQSECVIHGDVRLDNMLVRLPQDQRAAARPEAWLVDWEMVSFGDPAWDLAGALQELIVAWVASMPVSDDASADQMVAAATISQKLLHAMARSLWSAYRVGAGSDRPEAHMLLERAVIFSAARLVQTVFEGLEGAGRLAGPSVLLLQIAENLLAEPRRAQAQLYGIPLDLSA